MLGQDHGVPAGAARSCAGSCGGEPVGQLSVRMVSR